MFLLYLLYSPFQKALNLPFTAEFPLLPQWNLPV